MSQKPKTVPVYGLNGEIEQHTYLNARDMVSNTTYWSWSPNAPATPLTPPPFTTLKAASNKPETHEILERMGTGAVREIEQAPEVEEVVGTIFEVMPEPTPLQIVESAQVAPTAPEEPAEAPVVIPETPAAQKAKAARRSRFE